MVSVHTDSVVCSAYLVLALFSSHYLSFLLPILALFSSYYSSFFFGGHSAFTVQQQQQQQYAETKWNSTGRQGRMGS
jgi:hypothetical protein